MCGSHIDDGASPDPTSVTDAASRGRASRLLDLNGDGGTDNQHDIVRMLDQTTDFMCGSDTVLRFPCSHARGAL